MARIQRQERPDNRGHINTETSPPGPVPSISRDLLEYLEDKFPNALPTEGSTHDEVWAAWGTRRVVDHLSEVYRHQQELSEDLPNVLQHSRSAAPGPGTGSPASSSSR